MGVKEIACLMSRKLHHNLAGWLVVGNLALLLVLFLRHLQGEGLLSFVFVLVGILIGSLLPFLDHFIHFYFVSPHEATSQRFKNKLKSKKFIEAMSLVRATSDERESRVFHNLTFLASALLLLVFVLTSTRSLFGWSLVLSLWLHLVSAQTIDMMHRKNINTWVAPFDHSLNIKNQKIILSLQWAIFLIATIL